MPGAGATDVLVSGARVAAGADRDLDLIILAPRLCPSPRACARERRGIGADAKEGCEGEGDDGREEEKEEDRGCKTKKGRTCYKEGGTGSSAGGFLPSPLLPSPLAPRTGV